MRDAHDVKRREWYAVQLIRKTDLKVVYWLSADNAWDLNRGYAKKPKYRLNSYPESHVEFRDKKRAQSAAKCKAVKGMCACNPFVVQIVKVTRTEETIINHEVEVAVRAKGISPLVLLAEVGENP